MTLIASLALPDIGSSSHHRDGDSLKDADNLAFLAGQSADVRAVWLERCRLLREVDALSEADRWQFGWFLRAWRMGEHVRFVPEAWDRLGELVRSIGRAWAPRSLFAQDDALRTWDHWLDALSADYGRTMVPATLDQHDEMVEHVGGFFRLFPYLTAEQWRDISAFGALDQAWNNVRDLWEDGIAQRCYFPVQELKRFGIDRREVIASLFTKSPRWKSFAAWWLGEHLPTLRASASAFIEATDLHSSLAALRASCLHRYARIERVLRGLDWDYRRFPEVYEAEVRRELGERTMGAKEIKT